jgi:FkbM family methyltransferase
LIIDTRRLFLKLLRTFEIETVCDIGSLNGDESLLFRRALPAADIIALEPNPRNFALMHANERLRRRGIRVLPLAASDRNSEAPFFVVRTEGTGKPDLGLRGMSSLHRRSDPSLIAETVRVRTARIDDLLRDIGRADGPIALWIDTEGMAFETISGATGVLGRTQMLHVEVETVPCIGERQRLLPDVERMLIDAGFAPLATDQPRAVTQLNMLFVRAELLRRKATQIRYHVATDRLYLSMRAAVRPFLPRPVRRFLVRSLTAARSL